jgi:hypothetical protein
LIRGGGLTAAPPGFHLLADVHQAVVKLDHGAGRAPAVSRMHGVVAIAVKNNGWNRLLVAGNYPVIGPATLSHGDKCRGKVNGGQSLGFAVYGVAQLAGLKPEFPGLS